MASHHVAAWWSGLSWQNRGSVWLSGQTFVDIERGCTWVAGSSADVSIEVASQSLSASYYALLCHHFNIFVYTELV